MNITYVSYSIGCRNCWHSDGILHTYQLMGDRYLELKNKTEFEVMVEVEEIRKIENEKCEECGSSNVVIQDIKVNDKQLYDFDQLVIKCNSSNSQMLIINIDKRGQDIKLSPGGSPKFTQFFLLKAAGKILELIKERPDSYFQPQNKGNFNICIIGGHNSVSVERLRTAGITKNEITTKISEFIGDIPNHTKYDYL
jgi:hypothetical protein